MKLRLIAALAFIVLRPDVSVAVPGADLDIAPTVKTHTETIKGNSAEFVIDVQGRTPPANRELTIAGPAEDIRVRVDGGLDFSSIKALAASLTTPGMTDEEKAKACFYFAVNNFYDRGSRGCDDALEYASLWGASYCGNYATFLIALWEALGFPTAYLNPTIGLPSGHGVTQVYYDNQWHMYDSRLRGYFLNWDNLTIASAVDLDSDDNLIRRAVGYDNRVVGHWDYFTTFIMYFDSASDWYGRYDTGFKDDLRQNRDTPLYDPRINLRQGETLRLGWDKRDKWWSRKDLSEQWLKTHPREGREAITVPPIIYANGVHEFRIEPKLHKKQAETSAGIRVRGGGSPVFQPSSKGKTGYLIYKVMVPYFMPSMNIQATARIQSRTDSLTIDISTDEGATWMPLWRPDGSGEITIDVGSEEIQRITWFSPNKYSYLVRFSLRAEGSTDDVALGNITINTDLYYRPVILPGLKAGVNKIVYSDRSRGRHGRQVTYKWLEDTNIILSEDRPCVEDSVLVTAVVSNKGDEPVRDIAVRFFDGDPASGGERIGEDQTISAIGPGEQAEVSVNWIAGQHQIGGSYGVSIASQAKVSGYTHNTLFVQVDPENRIADSNRDNNLTSRDLIVHNKAELVLYHPSFIDFDRQGDRVRISAMVRNHNLTGLLTRAREARDVVVRFYDGPPQLDGTLIGEAVIPEIQPGEFGAARVDWDVTGLSGRHQIHIRIDPDDKIPERWQTASRKYMQIKKAIDL
ncbi:CARDB domain-containing protein [candidate division KSB1 bacterium]